MRRSVVVVSAAVLIASKAAACVAADPNPGPSPVPGQPASADSMPVAAADSTRAAVDSLVPPDAAALAARIAALAAAGADLEPTERRVLAELLAAAREMAAEGDAEAAAILLEDARSLLGERPQ
jgi:hypothetical protein